jgi:pimeloyl-ACP methyl ester carboxylesterase
MVAGERPAKQYVTERTITISSSPGPALDKFNTPIQVWVGGKDQITPPIEVEFLRRNLGERVKVEVRSEEEAGHFTFMNVLPPPGYGSPSASRGFSQQVSR